MTNKLEKIGQETGNYFDDEVNTSVLGLQVRYGDWIDGIQLITKDGYTPYRGGNGGEIYVEKLQIDEKISAVEISAQDHVYFIEIETDKKRKITFGKQKKGLTFKFDIPNGFQFMGIHGFCDNYLNALGIIIKSEFYTSNFSINNF